MARKKAVTEVEVETLDPRIYEIGYLLSPAVRPENLDAYLVTLRDHVTTLGGTIMTEGEPEFIDLAYEITHVVENKNIRFSQAYFGWIKFSIEPKQIAVLNEILAQQTSLIRYLLIKSVAENTVIAKNPLGKILKKRKEEVAAITDESVDDGEDVLKNIVTPDSIVAEAAIAHGEEIPADVDAEMPSSEVSDQVAEPVVEPDNAEQVAE